MRRLARFWTSISEAMLASVFAFSSGLVPTAKRSDWAREWRAELWHLRHGIAGKNTALDGHAACWSLARGLLTDAVWLRWDWMRINAHGSAGACLLALASYCLLCAVVELVAIGSWHGFLHAIWTCFAGGFVFVAVPALVVSLATYPLRPLRLDGRGSGFLSTRARWNLFLGSKVALTLTLGFLGSMVIMVPLRAVLGPWSTSGAPWAADVLEMLVWTVLLTLGLRWALLNQEQRCQKCLRMLGEPTRVGPPSRNFLDWSGTKLVCSDGHGLLHVAEMQGSWCWYDIWVEGDAEWGELFSA